MSVPPILSTAGMQAADAAAVAAGIASFALMEAAGRAVARAIAARFAPVPVLVLCGPGNNGGDGFAAARYLQALGWPDVRVALSGEPGRLEGDAARAAAGWPGPVLPWPDRLEPEAGLVVDAVFGTGLARPVPAPVRALLEAAADRPRVAVDVPSGLTGDGSLGFAPWLAELPPATLTVTFHTRKPAHLFPVSARLCGEIVVAPIGIPPGITPPDPVCLNAPQLWRMRLPVPDALSHKHNRGRLAVLSGPRHATGAARLAARAGARVGAGWTSVVCGPAAADILATHETALLLAVVRDRPGWEAAVLRHDAVVAGPAWGLCAERAAELDWLLASDRPLVLDADALTLLARSDAAMAALAARAAPCVLTPHDGEFARLAAGRLDPVPAACRLAGTRALARLTGAVVVRKGAVTVVAAPDGQVRLNDHASPWLATAGTGDVLAGLAGGLLAQGLAAFDAAAAAVWIHGDTGRRAGPGLLASDLEHHVGPALAALEVP